MPTAQRIAYWFLAIAAIGMIVSALFWNPAKADDALPANCFPWQKALSIAKDRFGEVPAYIAETATGVVLTVTVNPSTGSWTLWGQNKPDVMCAITVGKGWETAPDSVVHPPPPVPQMYRLPDGKGGSRYFLPAGFAIHYVP
jgi:hypothetical protein